MSGEQEHRRIPIGWESTVALIILLFIKYAELLIKPLGDTETKRVVFLHLEIVISVVAAFLAQRKKKPKTTVDEVKSGTVLSTYSINSHGELLRDPMLPPYSASAPPSFVNQGVVGSHDSLPMHTLPPCDGHTS